MNTTSPFDLYSDLYTKASTRCNEYAFAIGWAQGSMKGTILTLDTILKTKMTQAQKARAIRAEIARLEEIVKEIDNPATLFNNRGRA